MNLDLIIDDMTRIFRAVLVLSVSIAIKDLVCRVYELFFICLKWVSFHRNVDDGLIFPTSELPTSYLLEL